MQSAPATGTGTGTGSVELQTLLAMYKQAAEERDQLRSQVQALSSATGTGIVGNGSGNTHTHAPGQPHQHEQGQQGGGRGARGSQVQLLPSHSQSSYVSGPFLTASMDGDSVGDAGSSDGADARGDGAASASGSSSSSAAGAPFVEPSLSAPASTELQAPPGASGQERGAVYTMRPFEPQLQPADVHGSDGPARHSDGTEYHDEHDDGHRDDGRYPPAQHAAGGVMSRPSDGSSSSGGSVEGGNQAAHAAGSGAAYPSAYHQDNGYAHRAHDDGHDGRMAYESDGYGSQGDQGEDAYAHERGRGRTAYREEDRAYHEQGDEAMPDERGLSYRQAHESGRETPRARCMSPSRPSEEGRMGARASTASSRAKQRRRHSDPFGGNGTDDLGISFASAAGVPLMAGTGTGGGALGATGSSGFGPTVTGTGIRDTVASASGGGGVTGSIRTRRPQTAPTIRSPSPVPALPHSQRPHTPSQQSQSVQTTYREPFVPAPATTTAPIRSSSAHDSLMRASGATGTGSASSMIDATVAMRLPPGDAREVALTAMLRTREEQLRRIVGGADDQIVGLAALATGVGTTEGTGSAQQGAAGPMLAPDAAPIAPLPPMSMRASMHTGSINGPPSARPTSAGRPPSANGSGGATGRPPFRLPSLRASSIVMPSATRRPTSVGGFMGGQEDGTGTSIGTGAGLPRPASARSLRGEMGSGDGTNGGGGGGGGFFDAHRKASPSAADSGPPSSPSAAFGPLDSVRKPAASSHSASPSPRPALSPRAGAAGGGPVPPLPGLPVPGSGRSGSGGGAPGLAPTSPRRVTVPSRASSSGSGSTSRPTSPRAGGGGVPVSARSGGGMSIHPDDQEPQIFAPSRVSQLYKDVLAEQQGLASPHHYPHYQQPLGPEPAPILQPRASVLASYGTYDPVAVASLASSGVHRLAEALPAKPRQPLIASLTGIAPISSGLDLLAPRPLASMLPSIAPSAAVASGLHRLVPASMPMPASSARYYPGMPVPVPGPYAYGMPTASVGAPVYLPSEVARLSGRY